MKVLVIGGGGREHALVWKLHQSPRVDKIYCIPGNAGIGQLAECRNIPVSDFSALVGLAKDENIDLTVIGPENPLVAGIVDVFESNGLRIFGPRKNAAQIEGSKNFAKQLMQKYNIPTAEAFVFDSYEQAEKHIKASNPPYVVKADGLAAGKGVIIAHDKETAIDALRMCFIDKKFGSAGDRAIIEEYLVGEEVSVFVLTDGKDVVPMAPAQDYKRVFDQDKGPNTGGMGSYSPVPVLADETYNQIADQIMLPTVDAMAREGAEYRGVLYGGFILTAEGPKVLEFNCRFGDPETQAIMPRFDGDLAQALLAVAEGRLAEVNFSQKPQVCVSIVAASGGYPLDYDTGFEISGLQEASMLPDVSVFHAGTERQGDKVVTTGGRVLNVSALGDSFIDARDKAYEAIEMITFEGMYYRTDIALRACQVSQSKV